MGTTGKPQTGSFLGSMLFALLRDRGMVFEIFSGLYVCSEGERTAWPMCPNRHQPLRVIARPSLRGSDSFWGEERRYRCRNGAAHLARREVGQRVGKAHDHYYKYPDDLRDLVERALGRARQGDAAVTSEKVLSQLIRTLGVSSNGNGVAAISAVLNRLIEVGPHCPLCGRAPSVARPTTLHFLRSRSVQFDVALIAGSDDEGPDEGDEVDDV